MFKPKKPASLTHEEQFELQKLVLDKFLWIGTIGLLYGLFVLLDPRQPTGYGLLITLIGALILLILTSVIGTHFHYKK